MISSESWFQQKQTTFSIPRNPLFSEKHQFSFIGSCFSDEIASRFHEHFLIAQTNPFGTLFTPKAIKNNLEILFKEKPISLVSYQDTWHFLDGAARFQSADKMQLLHNIEQIQASFSEQLKQSQFLCITLGSAYYYQFRQNQLPVGNCHRIPQKEFIKKRFTTEEIYRDLVRIFEITQQYIPESTLIFTVSPVRHLRDGLRENVISKSTLQVALQQFLEAHASALYFPSFEIAQEELRDHRYFKPDLAHLNQEAIDYITIRLIETHGTENFAKYWEAAEKLQALEKHQTATSSVFEHSEWLSKRRSLLDSFD